jgi:hypothetical protein
LRQFTPGRASVVTSPHTRRSHAGRIEVREGEFIGGALPTSNRTEVFLSPSGNRHNPQQGEIDGTTFVLPAIINTDSGCWRDQVIIIIGIIGTSQQP